MLYNQVKTQIPTYAESLLYYLIAALNISSEFSSKIWLGLILLHK